MRQAVLAAACVLALSVGGLTQSPTPPAASAQQSRTRSAGDRGVLAVMRRDGLLIPFAAYKGSRWLAPWPVRTRNLEIPITIDAIPDDWWGGEAPEGWQLHLPGGTTRPVSVTKPRVYRSFCDMRIGLVTDYHSTEPLPMPPTDPYPKDGLASSSDLELLPIESVDRASPEMSRLAQTLIRDFDKAEEKTISAIQSRQGWKHPAKAVMRKATPVTIEAWYRAPMDEPGWTASYIEAVRAYPPGPEDDGCGLQTIFTGWMHSNADDPRKTRAQVTARVTYCDRRGVKYMLPFGRFHLGQQQYWVYQFSGFDQEWYEVARMSPLKMGFVVEAFAGGREGCGFPDGPM
jgi:hypothetical protein